MTLRNVWRLLCAAPVSLLSMYSVAAQGAAPVHIVKSDLEALIRSAADSPVQFAVLVPHAVSSSGDGAWETSGNTATWHYAVRIPTAVSLSFHATQSALPESATLVVKGVKTTTSYRTHDLHRGELWSRIQPGDTLEFTLTVASTDRIKAALKIISLQAGYRTIGAGVEDHPYYRKLKAQGLAASSNSSCVTNYECKVNVDNAPLGAATVGLVVSDLYQCTGTLLNDVPDDNVPYILTARHCETGQLGGSDPSAPLATTVYWDATTACGATLGSLYDPNVPTQSGAQTVVEQQDAWLIRLDENPVVSDAQFAGFDASGDAVIGGYTIDLAEGYDKQFVAWFGQAASIRQTNALGSAYVSNFLETVNQIGNIGSGASGSGLFDQNNHLTGSLTLGRETGDPSGYESCPVPGLSAPNGANGAADFTSLAAVWSSTADPSSNTPGITLKSVLDPGDTGTLIVASAPAAFVQFQASTETLLIGQPVTLSWSVPGATQCSATGGFSGDGWAGSLGVSGSKSLTEAIANFVTYTLRCSYASGRTATSSVIVSWLGPNPQVELSGPTTVWTNAPATLSWTSNVTPCAITGGGLSLTGLSATGTITTTQATAGDVSYVLTCGPPNQRGAYFVPVSYVTPSVVFNANGTDRLIGVSFFLTWTTAATQCTPSGGAPNDGWATNSFAGFFNGFNGEPLYLTVTTPGTFTYTLSCSAGPSTVQKSVTVTFENDAPYVKLTLSPPTVTFSNSPADYGTLTWTTNLAGCGVGISGNALLSEQTNPYLSDGVSTITVQQSGTYQISADCYPTLDTGPPPSASAKATFIVLPPRPPTATISFNPVKVVRGQPFTVSWTSTNATGCTLGGGIPNQAWGSSVYSFGPTGSISETGVAGTFTFDVSCASVDPSTSPASTQASLDISSLSASLETSAAVVTSGGSFTLTWSSPGAQDCTASGGGADGAPWTGSLASSGSANQAASVIGKFTYTLVCSASGYSTVPQQVSVSVSAAPGNTEGSGSPGGASTGSGGGGGTSSGGGGGTSSGGGGGTSGGSGGGTSGGSGGGTSTGTGGGGSSTGSGSTGSGGGGSTGLFDLGLLVAGFGMRQRIRRRSVTTGAANESSASPSRTDISGESRS